ncbi:hypothetical protein [Psychroserpens sp. S379A]|uniref:hypothetical protein n=1 Tax=Psychroserpens sp. S379A TaxID=3415137 RepID=UPI003C7BDF2B
MKSNYFLLICLAFCNFSCFQQKNDNLYSDFDAEYENIDNTEISNKNNTSKGLKLYKIKNQQFGMIFGVMPIPNTWNVVNNTKDNIMFEDPNGTKVYGERYNRFYYSNNPQQNYYSEQNGSQIKPPKDLNSVIHEDLKPFLASKGINYIGQFPLPQLAQADQQLDNALFKSVPEDKKFSCVVTEWEDNNGNKSLGVLRYFTNYYTSLGGMDWGYTLNAMEAPKSVYEEAKKDYINALLNLQVNPNWLQRNNQYYAQQSQQSSAQHQQRMAAIRAQGQAAINTGNTYSSILDSNHDSWKRRNAITDAGHSNSVNAIWDRNTMNDQSGNTYQVEGYYNNVWKGNDDYYIGTDNVNWNPNTDNSTNQINWEQLEYSDDN